jgi:hemerythrin-like domain-containing protein
VRRSTSPAAEIALTRVLIQHVLVGEGRKDSMMTKWFVIGCIVLAPLFLAAAERPTDNFRKEHAEIKEHLQHLHDMAGSLLAADAAGQRKTAQFIVNFLGDHIRSHAKWEEQRLYPIVDQRTGAGKHPFTSSMRYEHGIISRGIDDLGNLAAGATVDPAIFLRKTDRLLGVISAHFEKEEEVFLPILDQTMTKEQLEKELATATTHAH